MPDGQEFTNVRPIGGQGEFTNVRPIGSAAAPTTTEQPTSLWSRLTDPLSPTLTNPLARFGASTGATILGAPGATYHMLADPATDQEKKDIPTSVPGALAMHRFMAPMIEGAKDWANPATRPTWEGAKSVLPEAIGVGVGNVAAGEIAGRAAGIPVGYAKGIREFQLSLKAAERTLDTARAIDEGKVGTMTELVRKPIYMYQAAKQAKIGQYAQGALQADRIDLQKMGQQGTISASAAAQKARTTAGDLGKLEPSTLAAIEQAEQGALNPNGTGAGLHTLNSIKNLTSDIGGKVAGLRKAGKLREAAALTGLYDDLHQLSQARADELGMGKQWTAYIEHTKDLKQLEHGYARQEGNTYKTGGGILGDLVSEPNHASALKTLINPDRAAEVGQLMDKMKEEGVDSSSIRKAQDIGQQLEANTQQIRNIFIGKLRGIMKYPMQVGPAAIASSFAARASGVPGLSFVLPLIIAGKIAGVLDRAAVGSLLRELQSTLPRESMQPYMQTPASPPIPPSVTPPSGGSPTPTAPAPSSPSSPKFHKSSLGNIAASQTSTADMIQALRTENTHMKDRMRVAGGTSVFPDEEVQAAEKRMQENADLIKELQGKLKGSRRARGHAAD